MSRGSLGSRCRQGQAEPVLGVGEPGVEVEAGGGQLVFHLSSGELAGELGVDLLARQKGHLEAEFPDKSSHLPGCPQAVGDAAGLGVEPGKVLEGIHRDVAIQLPVDNTEDIAVEVGGHALGVVVSGEELGLSQEELAFYDALETNDSAVKVLGDETLRIIAQELVRTIRANVTIDWTMRENVRAQLRVLVKRILRKYGYPPDKQEKASQTVLEQAALLSAEWATA